MTRSLLLSALSILLGTAVSAQTVFINEIHYDNASNDSAEGVEIAGPSGTDLSAYSLEFVNGSNGDEYNTVVLSGIIADQDNGYGTINFPISGIQNGGPDGIALITGGSVVQFLCYEGTFTVSDAMAISDGETCTDIGVSEPSDTPAGQSLQLEGTGTTYIDFTWTGPITATAGAVNTGQSFGGGGLTIQFARVAFAVGEAEGTYNLGVTISAAPASTTAVDVVLDGGSSTGDASDLDGYVTQTVTFTPTGATTQIVPLTITDDGDDEGDETIQFDLANLTGDPLATIGPPSSFDLTIEDNDSVVARGVFINEFDADTPDEAGEFIELYDGGVGNTPLDGLVIVIYNGSDDQSAETFDLDGQTTDANGFFVIGDASLPGVDLPFGGTETTSQLQNGPDAITLFEGDATDFPNDSPITTTNLRDIVIYVSGESRNEAAGLLSGFGETLVYNDAEDPAGSSVQRLNIPAAPLFRGTALSLSGLYYNEPSTTGSPNSAVRTVDQTSTVFGVGGVLGFDEARGWRSYSVPVLQSDGTPFVTSQLQAINLIQGVPAGGGFPAEFPDSGANIFPVFGSAGYTVGNAGTPNVPGQGGFWYWYDQDIDANPTNNGGGTEGNDSYDLANPAFSFALTGVPTDDVLGGSPLTVTLDAGPTAFAGVAGSSVYLIGNPGPYLYQLGGVQISAGSLSDIFRVWNPETNDFETLTADVADPFGGDRLPVWNAAFAEEVSGTTSSATFTLSSDWFDPTSNAGFVGRAAPEARLVFSLNGEIDTASGLVTVADNDVLVRFLETGTRDFDRHDATKLLPPSQDYALVAPTSERGSEPYRHDAYSLPLDLQEAVSIPLAVRASDEGTFSLAWDMATLPADWNLALRDLATGDVLDLRTHAMYAFDAAGGDWTDRFDLTISPQSIVANEPDAERGFLLTAPMPNPSTETSRLALTVGEAQNVRVVVYDALGREVATLHEGPVASGAALTLTVETRQFAPGVYVVRAEGDTTIAMQRLTVTR